MRSGTIELRSGRWDWHLESAALGSKVVFRRWGNAEDQMVSWVPEYDLTTGSLEEVAREPLHRVWADGVGMVWQVTLEPVRPWRAGAEPLPPGQEADSAALVFTRGWTKQAAMVSRETLLGELTHAELLRLLEEAGPWR